MSDVINQLKAEVQAYAFSDAASLDTFRARYSGKKGRITELFASFRNLEPAHKAEVGKGLNELKQLAEARLREAQEALQAQQESQGPQDLTLPGAPHSTGSRHPISVVMRRIVTVFQQLGFSIAQGPEIETDWYNFTALNFPPDHPARDMQDTFFVRHPTDPEPHLLRTHTSTVQVRLMEAQQPPIRAIMPGRVYRNEAVSARSHCFFHQIEGLHVEEGVSFQDLKQTMQFFARSIFGPQTHIRLRPSFFPFTVISAEMDVTCQVCGGPGCAVCKHTGWVEVLGCGMVDPAVLQNCRIDPERYSGYAFGIGIERTAMGLYRIPDLRLFSQNDVRFLRQFAKIH